MIKLNEIDQHDFEKFSRVLKKAGRKGEIKEFDASYLATILLSNIFKAGMLNELDDVELMDKSIGLLMKVSSSFTNDSP